VPVCSSCQAELEEGFVICPKCGGDVVSDAADPAASAVDALLAKANLARIRAEADEAEKLCLEALAADPSSAAACSLMGRIAADREQWDKAAHWLQMAVDSGAPAAGDAELLADCRRALAERAAAKEKTEKVPHQRTAPLSAPTSRWTKWMAGATILITVVAIAWIGALLRFSTRGNVPVDLNAVQQANPAAGTPSATSSQNTTANTLAPVTTTAAPTSPMTAREAQLMTRVQQAGAQDTAFPKLLCLTFDPRSQEADITCSHTPPLAGADFTAARQLSAQNVAQAALKSGELKRVRVRLLENGELVFCADFELDPALPADSLPAPINPWSR
jgi:hypothetical protein